MTHKLGLVFFGGRRDNCMKNEDAPRWSLETQCHHLHNIPRNPSTVQFFGKCNVMQCNGISGDFCSLFWKFELYIFSLAVAYVAVLV